MICHHSALKGHKSIDLAMISIARGLSFYLGFLMTKKHGTTLSEYIFRTPIIDIIQSYKWDYECEFRLKDEPKKTQGSYKKIDYVMAYNRQVAGIEAKFPTEKSFAGETIKLDLSHDIRKLKEIFPNDQRISEFPHKYAFSLVCYDVRVQKKLKMNGVVKNKKISESAFLKKYQKRRNIFDVGDYFLTDANVTGGRPFVVEAIRIM